MRKCITVTGTIVDATAGRKPDGAGTRRTETRADGSKLILDLLNAGNKSAEDGNAVFEIICKFPVKLMLYRPAKRSTIRS
jgi:hypothetical protein